jgi:arsenate reductase
MLTFICYPKCTTCQKAKALLDSYHAQYEIRDIKTDNPCYDELKAWLTLNGLPIKKFFNTSGQLYKSLGLKDKLLSMSEDECLRLLSTDGMLVKRPLLVDEYRALVGFNLNEWHSVFEYDRKTTDKTVNDYFNEMLEVIKTREKKEIINITSLGSYRSKDHEAFHLNGLGEKYEHLGNLNLFMQCKYLPPNAFSLLPVGYSFRMCRHDELET